MLAGFQINELGVSSEGKTGRRSARPRTPVTPESEPLRSIIGMTLLNSDTLDYRRRKKPGGKSRFDPELFCPNRWGLGTVG